MNIEQRLINRDYIKSKSLIYIGVESDNPKLIDIFKKAFKTIEIIEDINAIKNELNNYNIVVCSENNNSLMQLQKIRELDNTNKPFLIIENEQYNTNPIVYIRDNLSHYIKCNLSYTEIMYILQHELQNHDKLIENFHLQSEHKAYIEMLDKTVIVSRTDLQGNITYANDIFCDVSKYTKDELIGSHHRILRDPDMPKIIFQEMWKTIIGDNIWKGILKNKDKEGETYITNTTIAPYYNNGEKVGYIAIRYLVTDDVTEKRNLKSHLTKTIINKKNILKEKNQEIENLKRKNLHVDSIEAAWHSEIEKNNKLKLQIKKFEKEIKEESSLHDKRIESYLEERREYSDVLDGKDRKIALLEDDLINIKEKNSQYKNAIIEREDQIKLSTKRIKELEDILEHREEQLKNK